MTNKLRAITFCDADCRRKKKKRKDSIDLRDSLALGILRPSLATDICFFFSFFFLIFPFPGSGMGQAWVDICRGRARNAFLAYCSALSLKFLSVLPRARARICIRPRTGCFRGSMQRLHNDTRSVFCRDRNHQTGEIRFISYSLFLSARICRTIRIVNQDDGR